MVYEGRWPRTLLARLAVRMIDSPSLSESLSNIEGGSSALVTGAAGSSIGRTSNGPISVDEATTSPVLFERVSDVDASLELDARAAQKLAMPPRHNGGVCPDMLVVGASEKSTLIAEVLRSAIAPSLVLGVDVDGPST
jgi:hypothetical protein